MASLTVENYLKAALQISTNTGSEWISTGGLAQAMNVSPGTVTSMLKTLDDAGLATYKPYEGMRLTESGRKLALRMLRRHRLIELFLVKTLKFTWDRVHAEAENMEHAVSDYLIDQIDEFLGHPLFDPHGDPIPSVDGEMRSSDSAAVPLTECRAGTRVRLARVVNQRPEFLRYLAEAGFELGTAGVVEENNPDAKIVTTRLAKRTVSLGYLAADHLLVEQIQT